MFEGDISLEEAIGDQISRLQSQKEELTAALEFCGRIKENQLADVDPDLYLEEMEQEEKRGSVFMDFVNDYNVTMGGTKYEYSATADNIKKTSYNVGREASLGRPPVVAGGPRPAGPCPQAARNTDPRTAAG